ncbi:Glycosyl transferase [uncultured Woeseiaceae bacterium]|uniref:Glycosyl transferase n=1 Tax=uncultured Woeseiaceae bacterium TaxID=1983305 RepID=A0A7D9H7R7_9GAMM|nr:Glycosyl transferase [uncultured Woeseiaceae bacterium]
MMGRSIESELETLGVKFTPVTISRSGINPFSDFRFLVTLIGVLKRDKPDVVLNFTIKPSIYGSIAAKMVGISFIASTITGLGYIFTGDTLKSRVLSILIKLQYRLSLRFNNLVFFQNPDDEELFRFLSLTKQVKTKVINGSGVDTRKFVRHNQHPRENSFIFVGRILRDKGVNEFIQAARLLKTKYPNATFTILGPTDDNPNSLTEQDLESCISSGVIQYLPAQLDVRTVLDDHEVFVLPSYREGTPRSTLEALSMSMPIVTTDVPGCRETVMSGSNGYLVEAKNTVSLAEGMERFIVNRHLVKPFGESSRALVCSKFDVRMVNESIMSELM